MKHRIITLSLIISVFIILAVSISQAATPQETLNQYIADLQKNPNDNDLREKIIKHVQTMTQKPAVPEDAKKYMVRGKTAFKGAKEANDFKEAAIEFQKALLAAPWLAEGYYNLGIVQDKAGQYAIAMESLKLYIIAAPNAPDVEKVKELIYEIEYRKEKAARESSPAAKSEKKQKEYDEWLKKIDGARYTYSSLTSEGYKHTITIEIRGTTAVMGVISNEPQMRGKGYHELSRFEIRGRETMVPAADEKWSADATYIISENGDRIVGRFRYRDGDTREFIYRRER